MGELLHGAALLATVVIPLPPVPASRPRVSKWGTYYLKTYANWMKQAHAVIRKGSLGLPSDAELVAVVEHICAKPKTTKRYYPQGDVDNFLKATLDAITHVGGYWHDDDQIVLSTSTKRFANPGEEPRTIVEIYRP